MLRNVGAGTVAGSLLMLAISATLPYFIVQPSALDLCFLSHIVTHSLASQQHCCRCRSETGANVHTQLCTPLLILSHVLMMLMLVAI